MDLAGRSYARLYGVSRRRGLVERLCAAVEASGGRVLFSSSAQQAPVFLGVATGEERLGVLCYLFTANHRLTKNRPPDEHRLQVRYGDVNDVEWRRADHSLGRDMASVDVTVVLGVHTDVPMFVGLDALLYDPLPMGNSVEFKDHHVEAALEGWHVWERVNRPGTVRGEPKALEGMETVVLFGPERLLDYVRLEREATSLGLDPSLRYRAALAAARPRPVTALHALEEEFSLDARDLLEIIQDRRRLKVAVRGGVAEYQLKRVLDDDPTVARAVPMDQEGPPDVQVLLRSRREVSVECKTVSPKRPAKGGFTVEVQKTRASKGDPASRYYAPEQFDVVAACLFPATSRWEFRFQATHHLAPHDKFPGRLAPVQRVDDSWAPTLKEAVTTS